jgi:hypothetical protein
MRFSFIFVLSLAATAHARVSASQLRPNIDVLTRLSNDVEKMSGSLYHFNYVTRGSVCPVTSPCLKISANYVIEDYRRCWQNC